MLKFVDDAKLKFGVWNRERKERAEAKKALQSAAHSEHGHGRFFLLHVPAAATICAAIVEWYWALLFCIEATGHVDWNYETAVGTETAASNIWNFAFSAHWPVLVGLVAATVPIVMLSMVWLPVQFAMRGAGRWRRGSVILCGLLANVLVIVSGTVVMNTNRQEQVREALVVEQTAEAQRTMLAANVDDLRDELQTLMNHRSTYVATAASVGAAAYERDYVAQARATNDHRLPLLERALGSARRADELRAGIAEARRNVALAAPVAAAQANVEDTVGRELNTFAQYVEVWRPPFVAVICTLIGIFGAWWTIALMQGLNPRDVLRSGWADEGHRIEDLRDQEPIAQGPAQMQTVMEEENLQTGEKKRMITPKPYWRTVKKGKKQRVDVPPEMLPDEEGVYHDGGKRTAVTLGGEMELAAATPGEEEVDHDGAGQHAAAAADSPDTGSLRVDDEGDRGGPQESSDGDDEMQQTQPPEVSEQEAADALAELEAAEHVAENTADFVQQGDAVEDEQAADEPEQNPEEDHHEPREPEQREDRLLEPPVAAE